MSELFYEKSVLERSVESQAKDYAKRRGWFECKITSPTFKGFPDRFYARRGRIVLAEFKKPDGGELSGHQIRRHAELREQGVEVHVFDNMDDFAKAMW